MDFLEKFVIAAIVALPAGAASAEIVRRIAAAEQNTDILQSPSPLIAAVGAGVASLVTLSFYAGEFDFALFIAALGAAVIAFLFFDHRWRAPN